MIASIPPYTQVYDNLLWDEPRISRETRSRKYPRHELLGTHIPGGDGQTFSWRNMLEIKDLPWIDGHKLEDVVVFPGACYLAMAIEAVSQAIRLKLNSASAFEFRHVTLPAALALPADTTLEIFTSIHPKQLSSATKSSEWWNFEVTSYQNDSSSTHATGSLRVQKEASQLLPQICYDAPTKASSPLSWYARFARAGINFSSRFQTLQTVETSTGGDALRYAQTTAPCLRDNEKGAQHERQYAIHPITMDAMLQSGMIANAAGSPEAVEAKVAVSMESAVFRLPNSSVRRLLSFIAILAEVLLATRLSLGIAPRSDMADQIFLAGNKID